MRVALPANLVPAMPASLLLEKYHIQAYEAKRKNTHRKPWDSTVLINQTKGISISVAAMMAQVISVEVSSDMISNQ